MFNRLCSTTLIVLVLLTCPLQAEMVTMSFTGVTANVMGNPLGLSLAGGEPVTGIFTYDTTSTVLHPPLDSSDEIYPQTGGASTSYEITIDGTVLTPFTDDWYVSVTNRSDSWDNCGISSGVNEVWNIGHGAFPVGIGSVAVNGIENTSIGILIGLYACNSDVLPGTLATLPNPLPSFEAWEGSTGRIQDGGGFPPETFFSVTFTSFQVVPEPSTLAHGLTALLIFGRILPRRASHG